jgi:tetratricopeptide (TPR) repeat protein
MADDLQHFLDHMPIRARRPTIWKLLAKWSFRQRRTLIAAAIVAVLTLSLGMIAAWNAYRRESMQRDRAHANYATALKTLNELVDHAADHERMIDIEDWRRQTLEKAVVYYVDFISKNAAAANTAPELLQVQDQLSRTFYLLEDFESAHKHAQEGIRLAHRLGGKSMPEIGGIERSLWIRLAAAQQEQGQSDLARRSWERAYALFAQGLEANSPTTDEERLNAARFLRVYAQWHFTSGQLDVALTALTQALQWARQISESRRDDQNVLRELCKIYREIGTFYDEGGDWELATHNFKEALRVARSLNETRENLELRARCFGKLGTQYLVSRSTLDDAESMFEQAIAIYQQLVDDYPWDIYYRGDLGAILHNLAVVSNRQGDAERASILVQQARDEQSLVVRHTSKNCDYQLFWAKHLILESDVSKSVDSKRAEQLLREGIQNLEGLYERWPNRRDVQTTLAAAHRQLGQLLCPGKVEESMLRESKAEILEALRIYQELQEKYPRFNVATKDLKELDFHTRNLYETYIALARPCMGLRETEEAVTAISQARSYLKNLPTPVSPKIQYEMGRISCDLAIIHEMYDGDALQSEMTAREGIQMLEQAYSEYPWAESAQEYGRRLQLTRVTLAFSLYRQQKYPESKAEWERAVAMGTQLPNLNDLLIHYVGYLIYCPEISFRDYARAIELGQPMIAGFADQRDSSHNLRRNIGIAYYQLGDYREAKRAFSDLMLTEGAGFS